jgi:hypothetical protein
MSDSNNSISISSTNSSWIYDYNTSWKEPFGRPIAMLAPRYLLWDHIMKGYRSEITTYKSYIHMRQRRKRELESCGGDYSKTEFRKYLKQEELKLG